MLKLISLWRAGEGRMKWSVDSAARLLGYVSRTIVPSSTLPLFKFLVRHFEILVVHAQKHGRCHRTDALVPIQEWMVLHKVEKAGGSHFEQIHMQVLAIKSAGWLRYSRLQQPEISNAEAATVASDFAALDLPCERDAWPTSGR